MYTLHINDANRTGSIYCFKLDEIVIPDRPQYENNCSKCDYFHGFVNPVGVECLYNDGSVERNKYFDDPVDAEKWSKYIEVRLGSKTPEEVDKTLTGESALTLEELGVGEVTA